MALRESQREDEIAPEIYEIAEDETSPEIHEIVGSGLLLKLFERYQMSDGDENPSFDVGHCEEIYRDWQVLPTPETVSTSVNGILGANSDFEEEDEEEEDGPPIIRVEEQEWLEVIQSLLTLYL